MGNFYKESKYKELIVTCFIFVTLAINNWQLVNKNYAINEQIYKENLSRIEQFVKEDSDKDELYLIVPKKEQYGFTPMTGEEWVKDSVKKYFGIRENVELKYELSE